MTITPRHRLALSGGWTVWRDVELRSAGFPAAWIDGLADSAVAHRVDEALAASPVRGDALDGAMTRAQRDASRRLRELARDPAFREALTWQNRRALRGGIESLLRRPEDRANYRDRQNEQLVASYAQRYCCKNERAGFFGASTPARLVEHGPALSVRPGERLIRQRSTYLEPWAIDALADRVAADPELRPALRPRRMPVIRLDGTDVVHAGRRTALPLVAARLLAACDVEEHWLDLLGDLHEQPPGQIRRARPRAGLDEPLGRVRRETGLYAGLASLKAGRGRTVEQVRQTIEAVLRAPQSAAPQGTANDTTDCS